MGRFTLITSEEQLDEFRRVTRYPKLQKYILSAAAGTMLNEIRALAGLPSLGWFVLVWTMLAHASTGAFTFSVLGWMTKWLDQHAWAGFVAGFALLACAACWPDLKPWFSTWIRLPKTPHERLNSLEDHDFPARTAKLESDLVDLRNLIAQIVDLQRSGGEVMDARFQAGDKEAKMLDKRLEKIEGEFSKVYELDRRVKTLEFTLQIAPSFGLLIVDLTQLLTEAGEAIHTFLQIRDLHTNSPVSKHPFSGWRPITGSVPESDDIKAGVSWARSLEHHLENVFLFVVENHVPEERLINKDLVDLISGWRTKHSDVSGDFCVKLMREHYRALADLRLSHAANFVTDAAARATTS